MDLEYNGLELIANNKKTGMVFSIGEIRWYNDWLEDYFQIEGFRVYPLSDDRFTYSVG